MPAARQRKLARHRFIATVSLLVSALTCCVQAAFADNLKLGPDDSAQELPDLPGATAGTPWGFNLAEKQAALGYDSPIEKWSAKVDHDLGLRPSLSVDYARQLSSTFGAGGAYTLHEAFSEVVINGIYAPRRNLRLRFAGAQLRSAPTYFESAGTPNAFLQNSYLFSARKYWSPDSFFSNVGVTAYTVQASAASGSTSALDDPDIGHLGELRSGGMVPGSLDGYAFNMRVRPSLLSSIELRRETSRLTYHFDAGRRREDNLATNRVTYSQFFENCTRLQGGISADDSTDRVDLNVTRSNWNISLSKAQDGGENPTSIKIAYAIPLGGKRTGAAKCDAKPEAAPTFEPLVNAAIARPPQFPREPLAVAPE